MILSFHYSELAFLELRTGIAIQQVLDLIVVLFCVVVEATRWWLRKLKRIVTANLFGVAK